MNKKKAPKFKSYEDKDLLRFITCGSVDDGKSTLIGNLLYNSKRLFMDQVETLKQDTLKKNFDGEIDYSLLLDGLASEREQGITIDVAYRYFETPKRKFIVADTPGHEQYTRNMVTGASTAELAVILVDATKGLQTQSRRHAFLVSMLQIKHVILAVNKMDLVKYSQEVFDNIVSDFEDFSRKLDFEVITPIPVSALKNDNVVNSGSKNMPWYKGQSFLDILENTYIKSENNMIDFRFPVQNVIRPNGQFRGFAGQVVSGSISVGEPIVVLPSYKQANVKSIVTYDGELNEAFSPQSIVITLDKEIDIDRGSMIVRKDNLPRISQKLDVLACWLSETPLIPNTNYILHHTTAEMPVKVERINYKIDVNTLHRDLTPKSIELNDIFRFQIKAPKDIFFDAYKTNKLTGSFILIDPITKNTVAACMIRGETPLDAQEISAKENSTVAIKSENITKESTVITEDDREQRSGHKGCVVWMTGLSGSGKSTIAKALVKTLFDAGKNATILDGDNLRHGLNKNLGFSEEDRKENIRRAGEVSKLFKENGFITICSFISPFKSDREDVRKLFDNQNDFIEVFVKCDVEVCKKRDPKGLYAKVQKGEIKNFTGIDSPYEAPITPELIIETDVEELSTSVNKILDFLKAKTII